MPVTTREYTIPMATAANIIVSLEQAFADLGWHDGVDLGYVTAFTNTPGSVVASEINKRYLVTQSMCTSTGSNAVFDVVRSISGSIAAVTLVQGGTDYYIKAFPSVSVATNSRVITGIDTTGMAPGMVVTRLWGGSGVLPADTVVESVDSPTEITISKFPTTSLVNTTIQVADVITIGPETISGSFYTKTVALTSGSIIATVDDNSGLAIGQLVSGSGVFPLTRVAAVGGNVINLLYPATTTTTSSLVFSDAIAVTVTGLANFQGITGFASGSTITNVSTNANVYIGAPIYITSGSVTVSTASMADGGPYIGSITGTGPYTLNITNRFNNFSGFLGTGSVEFSAVQGHASEAFDKDIYSTSITAAWAVFKSTNPSAGNKKLGTTFWNFFVGVAGAVHMPTGGVTPTLYVRAMTGFNPNTNVAQGVSALDWFNNASPNQTIPLSAAIVVASNTQVPLKLRVRQSQIDPNFASFSFFESGNNNRNPIIMARYNNNLQPWDLNDVFLGGVYELAASSAFQTQDVGIVPRLRMSGMAKRMAEAGYGNYFQANTTTFTYTNTFFRTMSGNRQLATPGTTYDNVALYSRIDGDIQNGVQTIAVYKNVPINPYFAPVPYYLPTDFVIAEVPYGNVNVGDTITVTPSEIYTVIQTAINQITYTSLVFAARTT